ncbi:MAG TPA: DUF4270 domain-containing protein [Flavobacterium sp.]|jgi:hypothetical protein
MKNTILKTLLCLAVISFASCDKDFNEIGGGIVGDDHYNVKDTIGSLVANTVAIGPVESKNLDINPLGVFNNGVFGTTVASFATQLELATSNPTINLALDPEVVSVVLTVPYYSTKLTTAADGDSTYELDSVYGTQNGRFNLKVYESGYYMRDIGHDGGEQVPELLYTNDAAEFNSRVVGDPLNDAQDLFQNESFLFSRDEHEQDGEGEDDEVVRTAPAMRLELNNAFFQQKIINAPTGMLANNGVFKNYFRGLYFKVEQLPGQSGELAMLNFKAGTVTVTYEENKETCTSATPPVCTTTRVKKNIVLNMKGNTVSLQTSTYSPPTSAELLYLKGGQGSVATIDLFGASNFLEEARANGWLINEANLVFTVNKAAMGNSSMPLRVFLYDIDNKRPIIDYYQDATTGSEIKKSKVVYGGIRQVVKLRNSAGDLVDETQYKIRLTNYIRNLVYKDSTNVRLGLSVTENILTTSMVKLKSENSTLNNYIPTGSVVNPQGVVFYGNSPAHDDNKRLKLQIYYTKPE